MQHAGGARQAGVSRGGAGGLHGAFLHGAFGPPFALVHGPFYRLYGRKNAQAKGTKRWLKSFAEPMPVILPINILEIFIKPLSLCMRLFGNVLGSFVIMELLKMVVPAIVPAVFSCYFDIFDGLIQAYVFVFLTGLFIKEATE